jgi:hypothetical protein
MTTTRERIKNNAFYEAYRLFIRDDKSWNKYNHILKNTCIDTKIGNESKNGEVFCGHVLTPLNEKRAISIKKMPLTVEDLELFIKQEHNDIHTIFAAKTVWREIYILKICSRLVKMKKSIHLPLHFFYVYSSLHWNKTVSQKNAPYLYSYNELAQEDLKSWTSKPRTYHQFMSCFLQIFFALYVMQYYCGFLHNDLHWGNILVFPVKKGGCWCYKIDGVDHYVPNEGFLFVLWDFGMASLVPALKGCKEQLKSCQDFLKILNTPRWIIKHYPNIDVPSSVSDLCVHIRSMEHKSMKDLLEKVIQKFTQTRLTYVLETFDICRSNSTSSSSSSSSSSSVIKKIHPKTIPTTIVAAASKETEVPSRVITMSRAAVVTPGFRISDRKNKR